MNSTKLTPLNDNFTKSKTTQMTTPQIVSILVVDPLVVLMGLNHHYHKHDMGNPKCLREIDGLVELHIVIVQPSHLGMHGGQIPCGECW